MHGVCQYTLYNYNGCESMNEETDVHELLPLLPIFH